MTTLYHSRFYENMSLTCLNFVKDFLLGNHDEIPASNVNPWTVVNSVGAGTVTSIEDSLSGHYNALHDFKTFQAFTESAAELVGVVGFTSAEHTCGDLASVSGSVALFSFDFVSFMTHLCLRNMLSKCSFCAFSVANSLSKAQFSVFNSSLS